MTKPKLKKPEITINQDQATEILVEALTVMMESGLEVTGQMYPSPTHGQEVMVLIFPQLKISPDGDITIKQQAQTGESSP